MSPVQVGSAHAGYPSTPQVRAGGSHGSVQGVTISMSVHLLSVLLLQHDSLPCVVHVHSRVFV